MKFKFFALAVLSLVQIQNARAGAETQGIFETRRSFKIESNMGFKSNDSQVIFDSAKLNVLINFGDDEKIVGRIPMISRGKRVRTRYISITKYLEDKNKKYVGKASVSAALEHVKTSDYGKTIIYALKDQDIYIKVVDSEETKKSNYRTEEQECSVKDRCYDDYFGQRCSYAMGVMNVKAHNETIIYKRQVKFLSSENEVLGIFNGSQEDESETKNDVEGRCVLNSNR